MAKATFVRKFQNGNWVLRNKNIIACQNLTNERPDTAKIMKNVFITRVFGDRDTFITWHQVFNEKHS